MIGHGVFEVEQKHDHFCNNRSVDLKKRLFAL